MRVAVAGLSVTGMSGAGLRRRARKAAKSRVESGLRDNENYEQ